MSSHMIRKSVDILYLSIINESPKKKKNKYTLCPASVNTYWSTKSTAENSPYWKYYKFLFKQSFQHFLIPSCSLKKRLKYTFMTHF